MNTGANSYTFDSTRKHCANTQKFLHCTVNHGARARVVEPSTELIAMNTFSILTAWPEDERDRKRAPARF
ncbi:MAG: hypothetical protein HYY98_03455 [Burkholderiales bacterium]|nr:hypothetical protein [Burkholderiales bacterium]